MNRWKRWFAWHFGSLAQQRIELAWERIEGLERANGELRNQINEQRKLLTTTVADFNERLNRARESSQATPAEKHIRTAKNWREFADVARLSTTVEHPRSS